MTSIPGSQEPGIFLFGGTFVLSICFRYNGGRDRNEGVDLR